MIGSGSGSASGLWRMAYGIVTPPSTATTPHSTDGSSGTWSSHGAGCAVGAVVVVASGAVVVVVGATPVSPGSASSSPQPASRSSTTRAPYAPAMPRLDVPPDRDPLVDLWSRVPALTRPGGAFSGAVYASS